MFLKEAKMIVIELAQELSDIHRHILKTLGREQTNRCMSEKDEALRIVRKHFKMPKKQKRGKQ